MSVNGGRGELSLRERGCVWMEGGGEGSCHCGGGGEGRGTVTMSGRRGEEFGWREGGTMREIG